MSDRPQSSGLIGEPVRLGKFKTEEERRNSWRQVPTLTLDALRVAWQASKRQLLITLGLQTGAGAAMAAQLLAGKVAVEKLLEINQPGVSGSDVIPAFVVLIGAMIVMGALLALADRSQRLLGELVAQHAFKQIIGVSTRVEMAAFENPEFHDQLERARTSAITRSILLISSISALTLNALTSAGIAVALLLIEPLLLPLVILSGAPMLLATVLNGRRAYNFEWAMTADNRERAYLMELLTKREPAKEMRVFGATGHLRLRYEFLTGERLEKMRDFLRERLGVAMLGSVASTVGMGIALGALAYLISIGRIEFASAVIAGGAMQQLSVRMFGINNSLGQVVESGMFVDDYNTFLRLLPEIEDQGLEEEDWDHGGSERRARFNGLEVEGISFSYPSTGLKVLDDISMRIDPGEVVALVGENGSGKTTLVKLITQLYKPQGGRISWAAEGGGELDPRQIRDDTTVLFQDFIQYHLTAADNIALGRVQRKPSDEAIESAAAQAGAAGFIDRLPEGYETRLGRQFVDGHDLSVGQWQRLALARAFFRGGGFLVLDEPTASLDPRAESELFQQMRELWTGRSVLLISHRFSSVRTADRIYVMQGGKMSEEGSHEALMEREGHYAELFSLQAAAYLDDRGGDQPDIRHKNEPSVGVRQA